MSSNTDTDVSVPSVNIIIPSWTGDVQRVMRSIERQTYRNYTVEVVKGIGPAARARNVGAQRACGDILLFIDDDAYFGHDLVLESLVTLLESDPEVAAVGTSKLVSQGATFLQKAIARQVPRMVYPIVPRTLESNPPLDKYGFTAITTTCCAVKRDVFLQVGGFDEELTTGPEDTDFFYRVRQLGFKILVAGEAWVYHDPPSSVRDLLRKSFWYGVGHALEAHKHPERRMEVIPLEKWYGKVGLLGALLAFPVALFVHFYFDPVRKLVFGFRPLKTLSTYAVLCGYVYGSYKKGAVDVPPKYMGRARAADAELPDAPYIESATVRTTRNKQAHNSPSAPAGPSVAIIVPSWSGEVSRLMQSIESQTYKNYSVEIVKGVSPAGRARNLGAKRTDADILLFIDDDAYFGHERVLEKTVAALGSDDVGVAGTSKVVAREASLLQKAIARQVPRMVYPIVPLTLESNPPLDRYGYTALTTTCCAVKRAAFEQAGGFDESLTRSGEDTDFFYRVRRQGWRMLVVGNTWVYHDPPGSVRDLLRKSFWYGVGHAAEARMHPQRGMAVLPLDKWYGKLALVGAALAFPIALFVHFYFDPVRKLVFGFRPLKTLSTYAVLYGYVYGWYRVPSRPISTYLGRPRASVTDEV
ncbi:MAG: glycosyltransferase [Chloroflexia bacterium]